MWAVGTRLNQRSFADQAFTEHWDGTAWKVVDTPSPGGNAALYSVSAISAHDIWAVGGLSER